MLTIIFRVRGSNFDAQKLAVIEKQLGQSFVGMEGANSNSLTTPSARSGIRGDL